MNLLDDIYYQKEYISLYLKDEDEIFEFKYQEKDKIFYNIAIKKPIKKIGNIAVEDGYYDLETAYGYGGFYINNQDEKFIKKAIKYYEIKCKDENIIAEFATLHPFNKSYTFNKDYYNLYSLDRQTVYVDTSLTKNQRWETYNSKVRNILRKCDKNLTFHQTNDIKNFKKLYNMTMTKNDAKQFYFFNDSYFDKLSKIYDIKIYEVLYQDIVISSSFFILNQNFGHYHLSANHNKYQKLNGNYYLLDNIFDIAYEKNIPYFHLGGGRTNSIDDQLFKFKKKFSPLTKDFYIAGKIYNQDIYDKYNKIWEQQTNKNIRYFLKYRLEI